MANREFKTIYHDDKIIREIIKGREGLNSYRQVKRPIKTDWVLLVDGGMIAHLSDDEQFRVYMLHYKNRKEDGSSVLEVETVQYSMNWSFVDRQVGWYDFDEIAAAIENDKHYEYERIS
ncbi:MAG: hypothetical protein J6S67_08170 [Methanobrevibacter sp.]|nr:hypothetical protein [Methanobrevibacter sp.]